MIDRVEQLLNQVKEKSLETKENLEAFRLEFLSKKGKIAALF